MSNVFKGLRCAARLALGHRGGPVVIVLLVLGLGSQPVAGTEELFTSTFEWAEDTNRDGWPDQWVRVTDRQRPKYVRVFLASDHAWQGKRSLKIRLNGGSVVVDSPPVPVQRQYRYVAEAHVRCRGLVRDRFFLILRCLDSSGHPVAEFRSRVIRGTRPWQRIEVAPAGCPPEGTHYLQIRLSLESAPLADLQGAVWIDQVRLLRKAYLGIRPEPPLGIFSRPEQVRLRYDLSGVDYPRGELELVVLDHQGRRVLPPHRVPLEEALPEGGQSPRIAGRRRVSVVAVGHRAGSDVPVVAPAPKEPLDSKLRSGSQSLPRRLQGTWRPAIRQAGFYRVQAQLRAGGRVVSRGETTFAVLPPLPVRGEHPFGWSFARPLLASEHEAWEELVRHLGPKRVKYPLWRTFGSPASREETQAWVRRLLSRGAQVVGVCGDPPPTVAKELDGLRLFPEAAVGEVFLMNPKLWSDSLAETMLSYGLQVPVWQWGADDDHSLVELQGVERQLAQVRKTLGQSAAYVDVVIPWSLHAPLPRAKAWELVCYSSRKSLPWQQLEDRLQQAQLPPRWWYSLLLDRVLPAKPSPRTLSAAASQMALHLLLAHAAGAQGAFVHAVDRPSGFLSPQGSAGPLVVPWTVTVRSLAGTRYVGSLALGPKVRNWLFVGPHHAVWVLWAPEDRTQKLPAALVDQGWSLWGRPLPVKKGSTGAEVVLAVGPEPVFLWCGNPSLARLARSVRLLHDQVPSVLGRDHPNQLLFTNPQERPLSGKVKITPPPHWRIEPDHWEFHLAPGEQFRGQFLVRLPIYASTGPQHTRVQLHLDGFPQPLVLGLPLRAGIPGLKAEAAVVDQDDRSRVVRVHLHNRRSKRLQVQCTLVLRGQPRRTRTVNVPPGQQRVLNFVLPREVAAGSEALLRTYLAEENAFFHLKLHLP